ncbi:MAG: hypothetical protein ACKV0T_12290 [Planctomycetales bacterium]
MKGTCHDQRETTMLSRETLERYRQMTSAERFELTLQMIHDSLPALFEGPPEVVDRRFELLRRENDLRNRNMLEGIARTSGRLDQCDRAVSHCADAPWARQACGADWTNRA